MALNPFELTRLPRTALIAEYIRVCAPPAEDTATVRVQAIPHMSRDQLATAILVARDGDGTRK